jgi:hypothetical protein
MLKQLLRCRITAMTPIYVILWVPNTGKVLEPPTSSSLVRSIVLWDIFPVYLSRLRVRSMGSVAFWISEPYMACDTNSRSKYGQL